MDIGVRDLKQHLSEHLRRVAAGETIRITDRGIPVALLTPIASGDPLQRGIEEGWIRPPQRAGRLGMIEPAKGRRRIADVLAEDRGE